MKHNAFVEANYDLDLVANRVLLLAIINARQISDDVQTALGQEIVITAKQYMDCFGVNKSAAYEALRNGLEMLYRAEFTYNEIVANGEFKGTIEKRSYRFLQGKVETDNCSYIALHFSNVVAPLVIGLQNRFTAYEIEQIGKLQSKYALRLYELAISKKGLGKKFTITLLELRKKLGVLPDEFERMDNFKRKVLDKSVNEINKHTDIVLSYEQEKEGRSIVGFIFSFEFKDGAEIINAEFDEAKSGEPILAIPYNADDECFADCVVKLLKKEKKAYKEQYSDEQIRAIIARANEYADELTEKGKRVAYGAIYRKAFEGDWGAEFLLKKQKESEKEKQELAKKQKREKELFEQQKIIDNIDNDIAKLKEYAEEFVMANQKRISATGIERFYFNNKDYQGIVGCWKDYLIDKRSRKSFVFLDEILAR
ncbi:RepB family plasmid replication initiator protein [Moraxella caprae]|uniref:RepB family plasmid replication initiator protein n=1 Tax=Moraxella caprae TaxID=90240 RepID=UPI001C498030|nr:RepB family plasmid replication initiator protein [Moraxella caprae]